MSLLPSDAMRNSLETSARRYQQQLVGSPAHDYLRAERHLTSAALDYFRLGYTGDDPEPGDPKNRISIPYVSWSGVLQIRYRSLPDGKPPKYLSASGALTLPYNTLALRGGDQTVYLCEGEIDTMTAWMCGLPTVGIPGANAWRKDWWRLFRYRRVVVLKDKGDAGDKLAEVVRKDVEDVTVIEMPDDDVNAFFVANGREELRKFVGADN